MNIRNELTEVLKHLRCDEDPNMNELKKEVIESCKTVDGAKKIISKYEWIKEDFRNFYRLKDNRPFYFLFFGYGRGNTWSG